MKTTPELNDFILLYQKEKTEDPTILFQFCIDFCYEHMKYHNYQMLKEEQEDFIQNVLVAVFQNIHRYDPKRATFVTWLASIINHAYYNYCRKQKTIPTILPIEYQTNDSENEISYLNYLNPVHSAEDEYFDQYMSAEIYRSLDDLKYEYKMVILMKDFLGFSSKTIAIYLHTTEQYVNIWRHRGKSQLKKILMNKNIMS